MKKQEFLEKLYDALCESMDKSEAQIHVKYYKQYIEEKVREGKKEKDVIAELENPRLIAKSLIEAGDDAFKYSDDVGEDKFEYDDVNKNMYENIGISPKGKLYLWGVGILVVLIIAAIIWAILGTIVLVGKVIVRFIVPITIGVGIYFVYKILRDK
jgi:uncharacterized membrane protein